MPRRSKNGRFTRQTTTRRRRSSKAVNLTNTAETLLVANAVVKGFTGSNLREFIDLSPRGANGSNQLTLGELIGGQGFGQATSYAGGAGGTLEGLMTAVKYNLSQNGTSMLATVILAPMAFKFGKKLLAKPIIRPANRMLKMAGVSGSVKV